MDNRQLMILYDTFLQDHRIKICEKLSDAYQHYYAADLKLTIQTSDFAAFVGVPLFIVWLIWANTVNSTQCQLIPALVLIGFGLCVRYYGRHLVTIAYRNAFRMREYKDVLLWYVNQCRDQELSQAILGESVYIHEKYDYFSKYILLEDFRYYEKSKKNTRP